MTKARPERASISVDEALRRGLTRCAGLPGRSPALQDAAGLVLSESIVSSVNSPRFKTVAMDGFAVRSVDLTGVSPENPVRLAVTGDAVAGRAPDTVVRAGDAVRVMTGAEC